MYDILAGTPGWLVLIVFSFVPAALAVGVHTVFRKLVAPRKLLPHHEVAGFLVAVVGVLYAVVLGFLVISVWSSFDAAQRNADAETNDLSDILHLAKGFDEPARSQTRGLIGDYALEVRDREWGMLAGGNEDLRARALMFDAFNVAVAMRPPAGAGAAAISRQASLRDATLASFRDLTSHRRLRVLDAQSHVQPTLYVALFVGGGILLAFVFLFGIDSAALQLAMTALVAAMIGLEIGVIFELDRPFWGAVHVKADAWDLLIRDNHLVNPSVDTGATK